MSPSKQDGAAKPDEDAADMAQAYRDLVRGEQTAADIEANLSKLESKLDALLAAAEADEQKVKEVKAGEDKKTG